MTAYTKQNLNEVEDAAPKFGLDARSARPASPAATWTPSAPASASSG